MMGSDMPFDEEDDHYPEGKLPLLTTGEDPSSDSEEVVYARSHVQTEGKADDSIVEQCDDMVTVNLSDEEPGITATESKLNN